jgi:hypothetical protein
MIWMYIFTGLGLVIVAVLAFWLSRADSGRSGGRVMDSWRLRSPRWATRRDIADLLVSATDADPYPEMRKR